MKSSFRCPLDRGFIKKTTPAIPIPINLEKELVTAIELNKVEDVRDILATGLNPNLRLFFKKQPLILALELHHWEIAAELIRAGATTRNKISQNNLGWMYQNGQGVEQDYAEALRWYRKAADQGHAAGQNNLGWMYRDGLGVEQDYAEALRWYRKAVDQGHAAGQNNLAWMHLNGLGVEQDYAEALRWYRKAADQGDATAQNNLAWMHRNGLGGAEPWPQGRIKPPGGVFSALPQ